MELQSEELFRNFLLPVHCSVSCPVQAHSQVAYLIVPAILRGEILLRDLNADVADGGGFEECPRDIIGHQDLRAEYSLSVAASCIRNLNDSSGGVAAKRPSICELLNSCPTSRLRYAGFASSPFLMSINRVLMISQHFFSEPVAAESYRTLIITIVLNL